MYTWELTAQVPQLVMPERGHEARQCGHFTTAPNDTASQ